MLFIVVDKEKTDNKVIKELYDCKTKNLLKIEETELEEDFRWQPTQLEKEIEEINIEELNKTISESWIKKFEKNLEIEIFLKFELGADIDVLGNIKKVRLICDKFEKQLKYHHALS